VIIPLPHHTKGGAMAEQTRPDRLLTVREVAGRLSVTTRTVHRYLADGKLPRVQLSERAVRIREADLERFIEDRLKGGQSDDHLGAR